MASEVLPVSVVIPTIGRLGPLRQCLESLAGCRPGAGEILVVDQSHDRAVAELVAEFAPARTRLVRCRGQGPATARNTGLREARQVIVAMTDDDCTASSDWVATAWQLMESDPEKIVTGRVLPIGDPRAVPSTNEETTPRDFTGAPRTGALFSNNMVLNRALTLAEGGFDERFGPDIGAEDNDLCYRWLKAGRRLHFEPALIVWHHDWRTSAELEQQYVRYMRGEGFLYAKHLRRGDLRMLRYIGRDLVWSARGLASGLVKGRPRWTDPRRAILRGMPAGLWHGWRVFWREPRRDAGRAAR
jgi:GT2 family glycosyltransferase